MKAINKRKYQWRNIKRRRNSSDWRIVTYVPASLVSLARLSVAYENRKQRWHGRRNGAGKTASA